MKSNNHSNALLVELLIVVLFFMISATVLLRLFADARAQSRRAELLAAATVEAQNVAEQLYASMERRATLSSLGFAAQGDEWILEEEDYRICAVLDNEESAGGLLYQDSIRVEIGEDTVLTLPCFRYEEKAV